MSVVDASVWVSVLSAREPHHDQSRRWLRSQSGPITIPALALSEVAGAVARRTGSTEDGRTAVKTVLATPELRIVSVTDDVGLDAAELAASYRLRGADAIYVAVARMLALPLATLDAEIEGRAAAIVKVVFPGR
jgi:predicted nucleic acid-binding protein